MSRAYHRQLAIARLLAMPGLKCWRTTSLSQEMPRPQHTTFRRPSERLRLAFDRAADHYLQAADWSLAGRSAAKGVAGNAGGALAAGRPGWNRPMPLAAAELDRNRRPVLPAACGRATPQVRAVRRGDGRPPGRPASKSALQCRPPRVSYGRSYGIGFVPGSAATNSVKAPAAVSTEDMLRIDVFRWASSVVRVWTSAGDLAALPRLATPVCRSATAST